jgi:hypothetical protein
MEAEYSSETLEPICRIYVYATASQKTHNLEVKPDLTSDKSTLVVTEIFK